MPPVRAFDTAAGSRAPLQGKVSERPRRPATAQPWSCAATGAGPLTESEAINQWLRSELGGRSCLHAVRAFHAWRRAGDVMAGHTHYEIDCPHSDYSGKPLTGDCTRCGRGV